MRDIRSTIEQEERCRLCGGTAAAWASGTVRVSRGSASERRGGAIRAIRYQRCRRCGQIQCATADLPVTEDELDRYREHNNDLADPRYREYLTGFIDRAVTPFVPPGGAILDFGSGPQPALARLLGESGYKTSHYDPFFAPDDDALSRTARFDAITAVEVVEHLHQPDPELHRLVTLLTPGGHLAIRTGIFSGDAEAFELWWYRRDITHVSFWTEETMDWLCGELGLAIVYRAPGDIIVFRKTG